MLSRTAQQWRSLPSDETVSLPACSRRSIQRAAWTRCSAEMGEAAAKLCSSLYITEHPFQIQNLPIFHATQRTGPTDNPPPSRPQKISSPHGSVHPLVPQLYRFSIGSPHVWRTTFAILRTRRAWRRLLILSCDPTTVARLRSQNSASQTGLHTATLLSGSQISFRSVRGREGRKSRKAHRRQTPVEQP